MADDEKVLRALDRFSRRKAGLLLLKLNQTHDKHREEDITRFLLLAGLDVWQKTGNVRFAMNRIKSRYLDETKKLKSELKREPQPLKHLPVDDDDDDETP